MRILIVHNHYRSGVPSGENIVVARETEALRQAGHEVKSFDRFSDDISSWSALHKALLPARVIWNPAARRDLSELLRRWRPDVVHVHNTFPLMTASVLLACADSLVPVVATIHNYRLSCANGSFFRDGRLCHDCSTTPGLAAVRHGCYRSSPSQTVPVVLGALAQRHPWRTVPAAYIFVSGAQRQALSGFGLPPERTFVKWNLLSRLPQPVADPAPRVIYVGRLDEAKGLPVLMRAWEAFRAGPQSGSIRLAIAGSGPLEEELRSWAGRLDDVDMLGMLEQEQCRQALAGSLAAIVPSVWEETFGLVAVEAMSAGVPVVASAIGALPELLGDGDSGKLFAPGDAHGLAAILEDAASAPHRWRTLGAAARASYERRFDPELNIGRLLDIYHFAMEHPAARRPRERSASH